MGCDMAFEIDIRKERKMNRVKETITAINETKTALAGDAKKPILYLLPILAEIALSLAVIADKLTEANND